MNIAIAERLKPFSHTPGAACLLPGTCYEIEAFPALIRLGKLDELRLGVTGPVRNFTLEQDLEKNCVSVFGTSREGFYRFCFQMRPDGLEMLADKLPAQGIAVNGRIMCSKEKMRWAQASDFFLPLVWERLSLGMHKSQDWDLVLRRFDLKEILPVLFGLGQKIPQQKIPHLLEVVHLLKEADLESLCRTGFSQMLVPRLFDDQHQGLSPVFEKGEWESPCVLLQQATQWIRSLFFAQEENRLWLLPRNPFDAGRLVQAQAVGLGEIDMEWASARLRRAVIRASASERVFLVLQEGLHSFRIRTSLSERGERRFASDPVCLEAGKTYYLDRFHK